MSAPAANALLAAGEHDRADRVVASKASSAWPNSRIRASHSAFKRLGPVEGDEPDRAAAFRPGCSRSSCVTCSQIWRYCGSGDRVKLDSQIAVRPAEIELEPLAFAPPEIGPGGAPAELRQGLGVETRARRRARACPWPGPRRCGPRGLSNTSDEPATGEARHQGQILGAGDEFVGARARARPENRWRATGKTAKRRRRIGCKLKPSAAAWRSKKSNGRSGRCA